MKYYRLALILGITIGFANNAQASEVNPLDAWAKQNLVWSEDNLATADKLSDVGLYTLTVGSVAYTAINNSEKRWKKTGTVVGTLALNQGLNLVTKKLVGRERPDGSDSYSFYSGHSALSVASGAAICIQSKKLCPVALGLAGTVGFLRIAANRHWATDVLFAGGISYAMGRFIPTLVLSW